MNDIKLTFHELNIPFKLAFKHNSARRQQTQSVVIEARNRQGICGYGESCPRHYVTNESIASVRKFFADHRASLSNGFVDIGALQSWSQENRLIVDRNPAAWCANELAFIDLMAREKQLTVEKMLDLPALAQRYQYSAVIGDGAIDTFIAQLNRYRALDFTDFKIKLSGDLNNDQKKIHAIKKYLPPTIRLRVDANNLWDSVTRACDYIKALDFSLFAIEEPLQSKNIDELSELGQQLNTPIILDESFSHIDTLEQLAGLPFCRWILNLRISKLGGLQRSLAIAERARQLKLPTIVGAHVGETSLLTRAGLTLATACADNLVVLEGAFGTHLLQNDICPSPVMFGHAGKLRPAHYQLATRHGLGIPVSSDRLVAQTLS